MRTIRVTDRDEPRIIYTYSAEPIDYVLGTQYVLESVEQVMQTQRLRATGVYVPEAANDNGETCHPMHLRAERFGLRGALYRAAHNVHGHEYLRDFRKLQLHGPTLFYVAHHHMKVAAYCIEHQASWPDRTLPDYGYVDDAGNASDLSLRIIELERPDEVLFGTIRAAADNLDATLVELEPVGPVSIPWQFKPRGWRLEDWTS